jgi:type 1 glutamine amidotransferase
MRTRFFVRSLFRRAAFAASALFAQVALAQPVMSPADNQLSPQEKAEGFALLFDGVSLSGWTTSGNPEAWKVREGQITTNPDVPGGGWWLRTTRQYRDFDLRLDFKIPKDGNSGVGLRSSSTTDPAFSGMEVQIYDNHGQEPGLSSCGAVYNAIAPSVQAVKAPGEWNNYRILLVGDTLNVWLNDQQIHTDQKLDSRGFFRKPEQAMPLSDRLTTGYIALQEHGNPVFFRNIRIRDLSPDPDPGDFQAVFNGTDLKGWNARGTAEWTVEDGVLVGRNGPGHLFHQTIYSDLEMRAQVKVNTKGNSGFYFRTIPNAANPDSWPTGYEAQVDQHDPKNFTGCIYDKAWPEVAAKPATRDNAWFDYRVRAVGNHIQTWINGRPVVDAQLSDFDKGLIVLQSHHQGNEVQWRDIQARDLSTPGPRAQGAGRPVRLFYCTHSAGFRHDVLPETREIMQALGDTLDWLDVTVSDDIADLTPTRLRDTDVVMLYTTGMLPMGRMREALMQWVIDGGALVGVHSATDTFAEYDPYVQTIGGTFDGHPWNEEVTIAVDDPSHPAMRPFFASATGVGASGLATFTLADEIYQFRGLNTDMHILMSLDRSNPKTEPGRTYPLAWTREPGKGRVFYTALGHRPEVWRDPRFIDHLKAGIRWAAELSAAPGAGSAPRPERAE